MRLARVGPIRRDVGTAPDVRMRSRLLPVRPIRRDVGTAPDVRMRSRLLPVRPIRRDVSTPPDGLHGVLLREADRRLARAELAVRSRRAHAPSTRRGRPRARDGHRGQCCHAPIGNWFPQCVHRHSDAESKGPGVADFKRPLACQRGGGPPRAQAELETLGGDTGSLRIGPIENRSPAHPWRIGLPEVRGCLFGSAPIDNRSPARAARRRHRVSSDRPRRSRTDALAIRTRRPRATSTRRREHRSSGKLADLARQSSAAAAPVTNRD
jgi:hypothetical protein